MLNKLQRYLFPFPLVIEPTGVVVSLKGLTVVQLASPDVIDDALKAREKALVWKQDLRIVPLCAAIYLLCYLDRSNIGMSPAPNVGWT